MEMSGKCFQSASFALLFALFGLVVVAAVFPWRSLQTPKVYQYVATSRYDGNEIRLPFKERGGPKAVGKWFSNKKEGIKGIKSEA